MDSICSVFECVKGVDWSSCPNCITRELLSRESLADLFALIERWRLPTCVVFMSPQDVTVFKTTHSPVGRLSFLPFLSGTEEICFIESAWGVDFYESGDVSQGEVIATTAPNFLPDTLVNGHGVARLKLEMSGRNLDQ